jgi:hypothetical protein
MTSPYIPRAGSLAAQAIKLFQADEALVLTTEELAEQLATVPKNINGNILKTVDAGYLSRSKDGKTYRWALGEVPVVLDEDDGAAPSPLRGSAVLDDDFSFALWQDGELMVNGARATETGIVLSVQQTAQLVAYLTSTADYIEYLGQKAAP